MKKIFVYVIAFVLFLSFVESDVEAAEKIDSKTPEIIDGRMMSSKDLDELRKSKKEYTIELTDQQVAEQYSKIKGVTIQEAYQKMSEYSNEPKSFSSQDTIGTMAVSCSWYSTQTQIPIFNKNYRPLLLVYVEVCSSGSVKYINTNKAPLLQEFAAHEISYAGSIKVELYNGHFLFLINGNFYNSTSTTHTATVEVNNIFTASYSVSSTKSVYASLTTGLTKRNVLGY